MSTNAIGRIGISEMDRFRNSPKILKMIIRDGIKDKEVLRGEVIFAISWLDKKGFLKWVVENSLNAAAKTEAKNRLKQL